MCRSAEKMSLEWSNQVVAWTMKFEIMAPVAFTGSGTQVSDQFFAWPVARESQSGASQPLTWKRRKKPATQAFRPSAEKTVCGLRNGFSEIDFAADNDTVEVGFSIFGIAVQCKRRCPFCWQSP